MNSFFKHCLLSLIVLVGSMNIAVATEATVIGYVNFGKLLQNAPQAKDIQSKLEEEFAPRQRDLRNQQKKVKDLEDSLIRDAAIMSEKELVDAEREVVQLRRDFKRDREEFNEDVNIRKNEEFGELQRVISETVSDVAKAEKFDLVILNEAVAYSSERVDLTSKVLLKLTEAAKK